MILSTRMQPMVRTASALISGLGSWESCHIRGHITTEQHMIINGVQAFSVLADLPP